MGIFKKIKNHIVKEAKRAASISTAIVDPETNDGFVNAAKKIEQIISRSKHDFDWEKSCDLLGARKSERGALAKIVYKRALKRVWLDEALSKNEKDYLEWLIVRLPLSPEACVLIRQEEEMKVFRFIMEDILSDGIVDDQEKIKLSKLAEDIGSPLNGLVINYFKVEGTSFFESRMDDLIISRHMGAKEMEAVWDCLLRSATALSISETDLLQINNKCSIRLLEHVILDAKTDDQLSLEEEDVIRWVLNTFKLDQEWIQYAEEQMESLRIFEKINQGHLPSIHHDEVEADVMPGELIHFHCADCTMERVRKLKSGPKIDEYDGEFIITEKRFIFISWEDDRQETRTHNSLIRKVNNNDGFRIGLKNGSLIFRLDEDVELAHKIFDMAIGLAKGRIPRAIAEDDSYKPSRHISRDVRQKVWSEYGGKCCDCGCTQYLEYDHIIPFSKGGSNEFENIQLLCRRCNLKKSDKI